MVKLISLDNLEYPADVASFDTVSELVSEVFSFDASKFSFIDEDGKEKEGVIGRLIHTCLNTYLQMVKKGHLCNDFVNVTNITSDYIIDVVSKKVVYKRSWQKSRTIEIEVFNGKGKYLHYSNGYESLLRALSSAIKEGGSIVKVSESGDSSNVLSVFAIGEIKDGTILLKDKTIISRDEKRVLKGQMRKFEYSPSDIVAVINPNVLTILK